MRAICVALFMVAIATAAKLRTEKRDAPPNIVWIFADDYGYSDIGHRNPDISTPRMDALAKSGIIFTNNYVAQQCSPSRGTFLSGRYPFKTQMQHGVILDNKPACLGIDYKTLPSYMKDLGYQTHAYGKWHLGYCRAECTPLGSGFDTFHGGFSGEGNYLEHTTTGAEMYDWHTGDDTDYDVYGTHSQDLIEKYVLQTLDEYDGSAPLFLYVAFHNAHSPLIPKQEFADLYKDLDLDDERKSYLGLVSGMDYVIGSIVDKLQDVGIYDSTYVFFSADNGGDVYEGDNSPFRGCKSTLWEGGSKANSWAHSPLFTQSGVEIDGLMHITDWIPTLVELAGGSVSDPDLDGFSQVDMILNGGPSARSNMMYNMDREIQFGLPTFGEIAARNTQYKLLWGFSGQGDGWGVDNVDFIYNIDSYIQAAEVYINETYSTDKRGGPYTKTKEQAAIMNAYATSVHVSDDELQAGTGHMMLFDLINDPHEKNDLSDSTDPDHVAAKAELIKLIQDEYAYYNPQTKAMNTVSPLFDGPEKNNTLVVGWCKDIYPESS
jgi:arylsulfatase A-like enzyme